MRSTEVLKGKLVVFEGMDGSGKSTLATALVDYLCQPHRLEGGAILIPFPNDIRPVGKLIRDVLKGSVEVELGSLLWLFVAEAVDWDPQVQSYLDDGMWVVFDRHTSISAQVYQTESHPDVVVERIHTGWEFAAPDHVFVVDVPAEVAVQRSKSRDKYADRVFETDAMKRWEDRRQKYLTIARAHGYTILNGQEPVQALLGIVLAEIGCR